MTSIVGGGSTRYFTFDSANRLVCADATTQNGCELARIRYDVEGRQVVSGDPENLDYTVYVADGVRVYRSLFRQVDIEIHAFGERIALKSTPTARPMCNGSGVDLQTDREEEVATVAVKPLSDLVLAVVSDVGFVRADAKGPAVAEVTLRNRYSGETKKSWLILRGPGDFTVTDSPEEIPR